jgi:phosphatidylserine/phosphatidylglycerophosphate/cardiolipin synthase-like enzyme
LPLVKASASAVSTSRGSAGVSLSSMGSEGTRAGEHFKNEMDLVVIARFRMSRNWLFVLPAFLLGVALNHNSGSAQAPCPVREAAEIHYSPGEDLERIDVALIGEAAKQIDMAAYVLTDRAVVDALRKAAERGVKVRIWRDASEAVRLNEFDVAAQLGGRVQGLELKSSALGGELMHLKGYCVDHRLLRTGSANFSRSGETRQDNDLVALRGVSVCAGFDAKFDRGWGNS